MKPTTQKSKGTERINPKNLRSAQVDPVIHLNVWEDDCQKKLDRGELLGYMELATYIYWDAHRPENYVKQSKDSHYIQDAYLHRGIQFLDRAATSSERILFRSIGKLIAYAKKSFISSTVDAARKNSILVKTESVDTKTGNHVYKKVRQSRFTQARFDDSTDLLENSLRFQSKDSSQADLQIQKQQKQFFYSALNQITNPSYVKVLHMQMQGNSTRMMAEALGIQEANARQVLCRAKKEFEKILLANPYFQEILDEWLSDKQILCDQSRTASLKNCSALDAAVQSQCDDLVSNRAAA